ncbi:MAG: aspartate aminotransferase family protein [Rhodospirillales bacterium]|jgi:alanine-glyoxylate transaminase / (R)-3-amino-2-methylpropionate-pyruvate transaminase|nr:aspartate aminotransferase family protein [Rhodospirillales bacterium]MBT4038440.1 aspartate aminotransferase family protein [Rhodospirillales bacterium]MBT4627913.1 aspartate aminotransferase family protein [Rhodospirillales bacterium]MBT5351521.1 aspartate aminotransferase family protein [Rhodospirillales bacterium]MBT5520020.1 aspartate aminotransferase family protein [Rhodospirillales bacterium]
MTSSNDKSAPHGPLNVDWSTDSIVAKRDKYYAASQRAFVPYKKPLIPKRGQGQYLWDECDNKYLDMLGMNLCISVGHAHPTVVQAVKDQVEDLPHCTTMFYHPVPAHFAEELTATMPKGEDWVVHFMNSGAEAADLALLMARSYTGNVDFLALQNAYHGATFGAQSLTGISGFRHNVPLMGGIHHVPNPDAYRGAHGDNPQAYLDDLDRAITTSTPGHLAGMIVEPIQGYGGIVSIGDEYIRGAFDRVRAAGGLCVVDEVQSGFGRTGDNFWAFEHAGVTPDIVIMAKGIGNGIPLAAVVSKREVAEALADKFYFNTYGANPVACAAGRAVLQVIREEGLQQNAKDVGADLLAVAQDLQQKHAIIGDVRGQGLMLAIELVRDRKTKEPAVEETAAVFEATREMGLIMSKSGAYKNVLRMVPPLCIQKHDVEFFAGAIEKSFATALDS